MAAYTGAGNFPYWLVIQGDGSHANPGMQSEQIPVTAGQTYQCTTVYEFLNLFATGALITMTFYQANGTQISSTTSPTFSSAGGTQFTTSTPVFTAPALSSYAVVFVTANGTPAAVNTLSVFQTQVVDGNGNYVNINYAFTYTAYPWTPTNTTNTVIWQYAPVIGGDSDSMVLGQVIEVMGGQAGVPSQIPELFDTNGIGPTFRVLAPPSLNSAAFGYEPSYDLNAPQPTQDVVASMLLDGERPFGYRASNRQISLPIIIFGTQAGGMTQVLAAREYLMSIIDQQTWQIKWTSADTGLSMLFDCFRALPSSPLYGFNYSQGGTATGQAIGKPNYPIAMITLEIQALPYGRSEIDGVQNLAFTTPLINGPVGASQLVLDNYTVNTGGVRRVGAGTVSANTTFGMTITGPVPVGDGVVVTVTAPNTTAQAMTVQDTRNNTYTLTKTVQNGTAPAQTLYVFVSPNIKTHLLPGVDSVTVTTNNSQNMAAIVSGVNGLASVDAAATNTNTGTSLTPNVSTNNSAESSTIMMGIFSNNNSQTAGTPAGWASVGNEANGSNNISAFWTLGNGTSVKTATSSYGSSSSYSAVALVLSITPGYTWNLEGLYALVSSQSAHYATPVPMHMPWPAATYTGLFSSPQSLVGLTSLSIWFGQAYDTQWPKDPKFVSNVTLTYTLTDSNGRQLQFHTTSNKCTWGNGIFSPKWTQINAAIPQGDRLFSYNSVVGYTVAVTNWSGSGHTGYVRMHCWLNQLVANPQTIANPMSPRGTVYNMFGLPGSARAPISVQCQLPAAQNIVQEITTPAVGNWITPPGVYAVEAECFGGGGAGASALSYDGTVALYQPLGWWKLSASANDSASVPHNGVGTATTFSQVNTAVVGNDSTSFNGTTSEVNIPYQFSGLKQFTVSAWVNLNGVSNSGSPRIFSNSNTVGDNSGIDFFLNGGGAPWTLNAEVGNGSAIGTASSASQVPATGWTHCAFTWDGTTITLYVNGTSVATAALSGTLALGTANKIGLGYGAKTGTNFLGGLLQEVSIIPQTLNANQVNQLANAGVAIGGGGGGGEYAAEPVLNVMPGIAVPWQIGAGGQPAQIADTVVQFVNPGLSHWTCPPNVTQVLAEVWGGGAAGAAGGGGGGGGGYSRILQTVVPGTTYALWCPKGGKPDTGKTAADQASRAGQIGWFGPPGNTSQTKPLSAYVSAEGGASGITGGSGGGYGASLTGAIGSTKWPGGRGGGSPGPAGGGGGGAGGVTGPGGVGGDSPASSVGGRWVGAGAGGIGSGTGGNGGNGAADPGFPSTGVAPGGGGGGGYTSTPLVTTTAASKSTSTANQVNYLGAYGANGMVQLTYAINVNAPTNGGSTTFGTVPTTGTTVTAHGGTSAMANQSLGAAGGTGSSNTTHNNGGQGALDLTTAQASWMSNMNITQFQSLSSTTYTTGAGTTGASASSLSQGVAIALLESTAYVSDLIVTDSAGNTYGLVDYAEAGASANGATVYAFTANVEFPITTSTTLTVTSATAQQYGLLWLGSPYLLGGADGVNLATGSGNGTTASGQFGAVDSTSILYQMAIAVNDATAAFTVTSGGAAGVTWYNAASTNSVTASNLVMSAYVMMNQAGGTGTTGTGDIFTATLSTANWAVLCIPLLAANQADAIITMDWKSGAAAASTAWTNFASISQNGMILVIGQAGSGASITSGPSAISDASGNTYTIQNTTILPSGYGTAFVATAPVTHALAAGTTGSLNWGHASAAPEMYFKIYWLPNVSALDANGVSAVTGNAATSGSAAYTPRSAGDLAVSFVANATPTDAETYPNQAAPWNTIDNAAAAYLRGSMYAAQMTDNNAITSSPTWNNSAPFALFNMGFVNSPLGGGGGAAGGPNGVGYPSTTWQFGGPAYSGGGKGGQGAGNANAPGGGAGLPGGGGAGGYASGTGTTVQTGGTGGNGMVRLTWAPPLKTFNSLIVHRPGQGANPSLSPICPIPITDIPNNTEYTIPSLVPQVNAVFNSTYTILLANYFWDSPSATTARQITVTINQYEYPGGPRYSVQVTRSLNPATDIVNGLVSLGEVTLPINDYANFNDQTYFTVGIQDTDANDRFMDVLFLDTTGQTVIINIDPGQSGYGQYVNYFIDEATTDRDLGFVGGSFQDRQHQTSVMPYTSINGGALYVTPGDNLLMTYSPDGAPNLGVQYAPRWYLDRTV